MGIIRKTKCAGNYKGMCEYNLCKSYLSNFVDALRYAEGHGAMLVETSAKTAANIAALFMEISK